MNSATHLRLDAAQPAHAVWPAAARHATAWAVERGVNLRDAIVLAPYAGLLPVLRAAFAQIPGWQPRIETTRTLAAAMSPPAPAMAGQVSFDRTTDRLSASALLHGQERGAAWARRDPAGFHAATAALVDTAHALLRAAQQRPLAARETFWQQWRDTLAPLSGPGASERWLARVALEWAAAAEAPAHDRLWQLHPSAWIGIRAGGVDAHAEWLLSRAAADPPVPVLWLDVDPPAGKPFDAVAGMAPPRRWLCDGLEGEAQAATLAVLEALDRGLTPVALIAQDRLVVRRIRALLERAQVALHDETGWTLATSRSAASVMALLRAAAPGAGRDELIDWQKGAAEDMVALQRLETAWRREAPPEATAQALWDDARSRLQPLRSSGHRSLARWLQALATAAGPLLETLSSDAAGRPLLAALHLDGRADTPAWLAAAQSTQLDFGGFAAWVDATLESATFVPASDASAAVVITPLSNAVLRPFAAVVMPGCDSAHLGAPAAQPGLLPDAQLRATGMEDAQQLRERERTAFAQLLRSPQLTLLRRRSEGTEPLAPSPLLEHAWQARQRLSQPAPDEVPAPIPTRSLTPAPAARPAPGAGGVLPTRLSASSVESLRACPYRFFAQTLLGLRELPELEVELEKRDFGNWLHGVLLRFHAARPEPVTAAGDMACLVAAADAEQVSMALDAAELLPFRAAFEAFATRYLEWLHARDADGWRYEAGELALKRDDPRLLGVQLDGRIDRVDVHAATATRQLIDYKTGSVQALKGKVAASTEDTQLAFYAALLGDARPVRAMYLALDDRHPPEPLEHPEVSITAEQLVDGLAHDLAQMRAGAGLPALGEGAACDYCEARGLCRRDHWSSEEPV